MTREVAHYKMFEAALETIQPNFPPGVLQADPRFTQQYFNLSPSQSVRGPWNQGEMPGMGLEWDYISDPVAEVIQTEGLTVLDDEKEIELEETEELNKQLSQERSSEVKQAEPDGIAQWSDYTSDDIE